MKPSRKIVLDPFSEASKIFKEQPLSEAVRTAIKARLSRKAVLIPFAEIEAERAAIIANATECAVRVAWKAINQATGLSDDSEAWKFRVRFFGKESLAATEPVADKIQQLFKGDSSVDETAAFFLELGPLLSKAAVSDQDIRAAIPREAVWFLEHWIQKPCELSLAYYTDSAIAKLYFWTHPSAPDYGGDRGDRMKKVWRRLGLRKSKHVLFRDVEFIGDKAQPVPFEKYRVVAKPSK